MTTKSSDGREFHLVEVIAFVLKYLKCQLEHHLQKTVNPLKGADFDWVITVPAIWKARGKRMMREAAYMVHRIVFVDSLVITLLNGYRLDSHQLIQEYPPS